MKHVLRFAALILILMFSSSGLFAQKTSYDDVFERIDLLAADQKAKPALELINGLNMRARKEGNTVMVIKAVMYRRLFQTYLDGNDIVSQINLLRQDIQVAKQPEKSILQSLLAETYWNYLSRNNYKISLRTEVDGDVGNDVQTWSIRKLLSEVTGLYMSSLSEVTLLQNSPISNFEEVLIGDKSTRYLRPTLYDFLANSALPIFRDSRLNILSSLPEDEVKSANRAKGIFENIINYHQKNGNKAAYCDAELARLKYFHKDANGFLENRPYYNSLNELLKRSEGTEIYSDVLYEIALLYRNDKVEMDKGVNNLKVAVELAGKAIKAYPKGSGASSAQFLLTQIRGLQLSLKIRGFVAPGQIIDVLYNYKNMDSLYLSVYRLTSLEAAVLNLGIVTNYTQFLKRVTPMRSWSRLTPLSDDHRGHYLSDTIGGLPVGEYILIVQNKPILDTLNEGIINRFIKFKVSGLVVSKRTLSKNRTEYRVLESVGGLPVKGVKIEKLPNTKVKNGDKSLAIFTDSDGFASASNFSQREDEVLVTLDGDSTYLDIKTFYGNSSEEEEETKIILFTDRPIYRPGQTIFYKGIVLKEKDHKSSITVSEKVSLIFKDVNNDDLSTKEHISNEYGSFHGSFIIPTGKLNGTMKILTDFGSVNVRVEEYKRPTFEVKFKNTGQEYLYNDTVRVNGVATNYAGYAIANVTVKYKVNWGSRSIAIGSTNTDGAGNFKVAFFPLSKDEIGNGYSEYNVSVEVIDLSGETRMANKYLQVNKKGLSFGVPNDSKEIFLEKPRETTLYVHTNSGNAVKAEVQIKWLKLEPPRNLERDSLRWEYRSSDNVDNWKATSLAFEQNITTMDGEIRFTIKKGHLKPGYYRRIVTAVSEALDTGVYTRVYRVFDEKPDYILVRSEWVVLQNEKLTLGEDAMFRVAGFRDGTNVYYEVTAKQKVVEHGWVKASPIQTILKVPVKESYGDVFNVAFMMVQDGEWHQWQSKVYVADPSKELDVKFLSFRDKLQPGEKDNWKLRITNMAGEKKMVELAATLYDASLDMLNPMDYRFYNNRGSTNVKSWKVDINTEGDLGGVYFLNRSNTPNILFKVYERLNTYSYSNYADGIFSFANFLEGVKVEVLKRSLKKALEQVKVFKNTGKFYGLVKDDLGYGIPYVKIMVNYKLAGSTDQFGVYAINANAGDQVTFTSAGFATQTINVVKLERHDIVLKEIINSLGEVVIRGYVKRTREVTTGSTFIVSGKEVVDVPVGNVEQLLQGKVAGLNIQNSYTDGFPNRIDPGNPGSLGRIIPRSNFSESAFFYPQLRTNSAGEIDIEFTIPESLTRYKMMGFAHTKAFETLYFSRELITQKQFAISANAPRFFRERDTIVLAAKLNNMSGKMLRGKAYLELRDAVTGNVISIFAPKTQATQNFELSDKNNFVLNWPLIIPVGVSAITYKVVAESGKYSDGEESTVPVLTNSILVTEAIPLNVRGNTSKTFTLDKLLQSGNSTTILNQSLTLEFTDNPIWYAIQALPYLMEYPYECAEQTMSRFYANSFATGILNSSPKIKAVFEVWQKSESNLLSSNLEKNAQLKALLLEETPWVRNAGDEGERKKRLGVLFNLNRMSSELKANFEKLTSLQNADGSFSWFKGMVQDRYITQQIVLNMSQLKYLKLIDEETYPAFSGMLNKALIYLDGQFSADFTTKSPFKGFYSMPLHYLYARSYSKQINEVKVFRDALNESMRQVTANWLKMSTYEQGLAALVLHRNGRHLEAMKIVNSLKERIQQSEELGMFWPDNRLGWWWYQSPVEAQALMIEVFDEVANDAVAVEEMKIWLLKNKQANDWRTTKATTAACYALLMRGSDLVNESAAPEITIGGKTTAQLGLATPVEEAGTGYQKIIVEGPKVKPEMGSISIKNNNKSIAWGGLYWQYFEQADKVTNSGTGITIKKELFLQTETVRGPLLTRLSSSNILKKGDLLKVRIEILCDRPMEYLHLKDMRSAGFEPINVISQYKYQDGLGYYESTKDASSNFFIGYMPKGIYVFEYPLRVNISGNFSNGVTSLQSMYAPEYITHSEGLRMTVK